ncbi:hypothetical protein ACP70R_034689 [Stipagrostis hirtigluma subsp. patula]
MTPVAIGPTASDPRVPSTATTVSAAAGMAATEEVAPHGGGRRQGDDEAAFFVLEFTLTGHHLSVAFDADEGEKEKEGVKATELDHAVDGEKLVAAAEAGHRGEEAQDTLRQLGPAARLRALVRRLRKPKKAAGRPAGDGALAAAPEENRRLGRSGAQAARRSRVGAVADEVGRTPTRETAVVKYLSSMPTLARRRALGSLPDPSPPFRPQAATAVQPGRMSRGEDGLKEACKRVVAGRSSVAATPPPVPSRRRDDSLRQAQDDIASAISHCKLSLHRTPQEVQTEIAHGAARGPTAGRRPATSGFRRRHSPVAPRDLSGV